MANDNDIIVNLVLEGKDKFKADLAATKVEADKLGDSADQTTQAFKEFFDEQRKGHLSLQADAKKSAEQLEALKEAGLIDGEPYRVAKEEITKLAQKAKDAREQLAYMALENKGVTALSQGLRGASAVMQGLVGATAIFGEKNKNLEQSLIKLNAVMLVGNSIRETTTLLTENSTLKLYALEKAQAAYSFVVGTSTGALKLFRIALAATGIGLAVIAIIALVQNWDKLADAIGGSNKELAKSIELDRQKLIMADEALGKLEIITLNMQKNGVEEAEISKFKQQAYEDLLKAYDVQISKQETLVTANKKTQDSNNSSAKGYKAFSNVIFGVNSAVEKSEKQLSDLREKRTALYKLLLQEQVGALNDNKDKIKKPLNDLMKDFPEGGIINFILFGNAGGLSRDIAKNEAIIKAFIDRQIILGGQLEKARADASGQSQEEIELQFDKRAAAATSYYDLILGAEQQVSQIVQGIAANRANKEIAALDRKKEKGIISEKQYQQALSKIKNEQARKDHRAAVINAFLAIPQAFLAGLVKGGFVLAAIYAALATAQAAIVAASPIPKFFKGIIDIPLGRNPKGRDTIPAMLHEHESVIPADKTLKYKKPLKAMMNNTFDKIYSQNMINPVLQMNDREIKGESFGRLYEQLATLGGYMKQDYRTNEQGNNLIKQLIEVVKPKNKNA